MKITIVTGFFLPVPAVRGGSTEKIWHRLAQQFAAAGHEVTIVSRRWPGFANRETVAGVHHVRVRGANHSRSLLVNLAHDFFWGLRVARVLPPADIVVCNTPILPAWLGRIRQTSGRVVAVVARMPKGHAQAYGRVDLLLALSDAVGAALRAANPGLADRVVPFPYPIDWNLHAQAGAKAVAPTPLTIGYIGRIHPEKGLRLLLEAASLLTRRSDLPPWRLELIGPSSIPQGGGGEVFRDGLIADFAPVLGPRLELRGPEFDPAALARRYGGIDVFCYPSLAEKGETFGVAIAEAMAAGAAPVVSALGCFRELVHDGRTGLVFEHSAPDAAERLAAVLTRLLSNESERRTMGERAQAHVRRYDFAEVSRQVLEHFSELVRRSPPSVARVLPTAPADASDIVKPDA
ncbi:MAG: glycosyltransferase family 4 protein [Opitutaceae bacterium]|nr:glycosyltransferase family 4 protein [Opitutaceae bacterium]